MNSTSSEFQAANQILYSARILHSPGFPVTACDGESQRAVGEADFIDVNNNGAADICAGPSDFFRESRIYAEPVLDYPYASLKAAAASMQIEVMTSERGANLLIKDFGVSIGKTVFQQDQLISCNYRSIGTLVQAMAPLAPGAKWAIDFLHDQFYVYQPGT